jgi:hypothetical protein
MMRSTLKNIPIAISILHEQEYNNVCLMFKTIHNKDKKRRAFSEKNNTNNLNNEEREALLGQRSQPLIAVKF